MQGVTFLWLVAGTGTGVTAREHLLEVVVLDLHLPGRPGFEVLDDLRRHPAARDIPVLLTSGTTAPPAVPRPMYAHALLPKPFDFDLLLKHVWRAIDARVHGRPVGTRVRVRLADGARHDPRSA